MEEIVENEQKPTSTIKREVEDESSVHDDENHDQKRRKLNDEEDDDNDNDKKINEEDEDHVDDAVSKRKPAADAAYDKEGKENVSAVPVSTDADDSKEQQQQPSDLGKDDLSTHVAAGGDNGEKSQSSQGSLKDGEKDENDNKEKEGGGGQSPSADGGGGGSSEKDDNGEQGRTAGEDEGKTSTPEKGMIYTVMYFFSPYVFPLCLPKEIVRLSHNFSLFSCFVIFLL